MRRAGPVAALLLVPATASKRKKAGGAADGYRRPAQAARRRCISHSMRGTAVRANLQGSQRAQGHRERTYRVVKGLLSVNVGTTRVTVAAHQGRPVKVSLLRRIRTPHFCVGNDSRAARQKRQVQTPTVSKLLAFSTLSTLQPALDLLDAQLAFGSDARYHCSSPPVGSRSAALPRTCHYWRRNPVDVARRQFTLADIKKRGRKRGLSGASGGAGGNRTPVRKPLSGRSTRLAD